MVGRLLGLSREHLAIVVVLPITFALMCHQRGVDDALWMTGSLGLILAQIVVVMYSLVYGVYHEKPGSWYLPTLGVLIAYYGYLVYADHMKLLLVHSILSIGPALLLFGVVVRYRHARRR